MSLLRRFYRLAFGKYLLATNTVSSGILLAFGDMIEQRLSNQRKINAYNSKKIIWPGTKDPRKNFKYDTKRINQMFWTGLSQGPLHHYFYMFLNYLWPGSKLKVVLYKIILDEAVMSPVSFVQFFYFLGWFENKSITEINMELKEKFIPLMIADMCVWPGAQFFNFYYIPYKYQVTYINAITMVFNIYLSYVKYGDAR